MESGQKIAHFGLKSCERNINPVSIMAHFGSATNIFKKTLML